MKFQRKAAGRCKGVGSCRRERCLFLLEEECICKRKVLFRGDLLKAEGDHRGREVFFGRICFLEAARREFFGGLAALRGERKEREREEGDFWRALERRLPLESF